MKDNIPLYEGELRDIQESLIKSFKKNHLNPICLQTVTEYKEPFIISIGKTKLKVQLQISLTTDILGKL